MVLEQLLHLRLGLRDLGMRAVLLVCSILTAILAFLAQNDLSDALLALLDAELQDLVEGDIRLLLV